MARKDTVQEQYEIVTQQLYENKAYFKEYLAFSGRFFKMPSAQAMILFGKRPNAQMVAEYDTWKQFGRQVKRGASSTAVLSDGKLIYYFDIEQTTGENIPFQWTLNKETAQKFVQKMSLSENREFPNLSRCVDYLTAEPISRQSESLVSRLSIPEKDKAAFIKSFATMVRFVAAARCEYKSKFNYNGEALDLSALDMLGSKDDFELLTEHVQSAAKSALLNMEQKINDVIYERSVDNEREQQNDMVRGGQEILSRNEDRKRDNLQARSENVHLSGPDSNRPDGRAAGIDEPPDRTLGAGMEEFYAGELPAEDSVLRGSNGMGADTPQDRPRSTRNDYGDTGTVYESEAAPDNGGLYGNGEVGKRASDDNTSADNGGISADREVNTTENTAAEEQSPAVFISASEIAERVAALNRNIAQKYDGQYEHLSSAEFTAANVIKMINGGEFKKIRDYLFEIYKEAYYNKEVIDEGAAAESISVSLDKLRDSMERTVNHTEEQVSDTTPVQENVNKEMDESSIEQMRLFPEPLNSKQQEELDKLTNELTREYAQWESIFLDGGTDPFYEDGVGLDLTRNHIIYYKNTLLEKYPNNLPEIYNRELPPEMPQDYQSVKAGDTLRFEYGDYLVLENKEKVPDTGDYYVTLQDENGEIITQKLRDIKTKFRNLTNHGEIESRAIYSTISAHKVGDFYEFYGEDARKAAKILNITLTKKNGEDMTGIPAHALAAYTEQLEKSFIRLSVEDNQQEKALEIPDDLYKFYVDKENERVTWAFFEPNTETGGQLVYSDFSFDTLFEGVIADDVLEYIFEHSDNVRRIDAGTPEFEKAASDFLTDGDEISSYQEDWDKKLSALAPRFAIYQLRSGDDLHYHRFTSIDTLKKVGLYIDRENYNRVYRARLKENETLESLYVCFNQNNRPTDFHGHSMSVSDVIVMLRDGEATAHYVDDMGFAEIPDFMLSLEERVARRTLTDKLEIVVDSNQLASDEMDELSEFLFEFDKKKGRSEGDNWRIGNGMKYSELYSLAERYNNGENISAELAKGILRFGGKNYVRFFEDKEKYSTTQDFDYTSKEDENGVTFITEGGYEISYTWEELGNALISAARKELDRHIELNRQYREDLEKNGSLYLAMRDHRTIYLNKIAGADKENLTDYRLEYVEHKGAVLTAANAKNERVELHDYGVGNYNYIIHGLLDGNGINDDKYEVSHIEREPVFKVEANPENGREGEAFLQAYEKTDSGTLIPRDILYVGSFEECNSCAEELRLGEVSQAGVRGWYDDKIQQQEETIAAVKIYADTLSEIRGGKVASLTENPGLPFNISVYFGDGESYNRYTMSNYKLRYDEENGFHITCDLGDKRKDFTIERFGENTDNLAYFLYKHTYLS